MIVIKSKALICEGELQMDNKEILIKIISSINDESMIAYLLGFITELLNL